MSGYVFTAGRGSDPDVLDVWAPDTDGNLAILGNVYKRGRQGWAARWAALGAPDRVGLPNRAAAARALSEINEARKKGRG